jgi:hypothetical protein
MDTEEKTTHLKNFAYIAALTAGAMWGIPKLGQLIGSGWEEGSTNRYGGLLGRRDEDEDEDCGCGG